MPLYLKDRAFLQCCSSIRMGPFCLAALPSGQHQSVLLLYHQDWVLLQHRFTVRMAPFCEVALPLGWHHSSLLLYHQDVMILQHSASPPWGTYGVLTFPCWTFWGFWKDTAPSGSTEDIHTSDAYSRINKALMICGSSDFDWTSPGVIRTWALSEQQVLSEGKDLPRAPVFNWNVRLKLIKLVQLRRSCWYKTRRSQSVAEQKLWGMFQLKLTHLNQHLSWKTTTFLFFT